MFFFAATSCTIETVGSLKMMKALEFEARVAAARGISGETPAFVTQTDMKRLAI